MDAPVNDPPVPQTDARQRATPYLDALRAHAARSPVRLNVPAHKGGPLASPRLLAGLGDRALEMDIPPQTPGIDLGPGSTPLDAAEALAADAWRAARTWFVLDGASDANRAACLALATRGRRVLVQRNVHVSTIAGLILADLVPVFVAPEVDHALGVAHCVTPDALRAALAGGTDDLAGIVLVSPTYFGAAADLATLVAIGHEHGLPVVVDEAWGAHFAFHDGLPQAALDAGADLVISSTHKMLGSLTQSAMLHLGRGSRLPEDAVDRAVTLLRTTSWSALLGASLDAARQYAACEGRARIERSLPALARLRDDLRAIPGVGLLDGAGGHGIVGWDPFRLAIVLPPGGPTGGQVATMLRERAQAYVELTSSRVVVAILGLGEESAPGLVECLAATVDGAPATPRAADPPAMVWGEPAMAPREAFLAPGALVAPEAAVGRVSADTLAVYPPGIPNVVPGERFTPEVIAVLTEAARTGEVIRGAIDPALSRVRVTAA